MEYLLWMFGYSLVGHNRNALIFFFIGKGRDGKSTVMRVNRDMLGHSMALLTDASAYSTPKLPPIPGESCHRFHGKAATCSTRKLPLIP